MDMVVSKAFIHHEQKGIFFLISTIKYIVCVQLNYTKVNCSTSGYWTTQINVAYTKGLCFLLSISFSTHNYITQALFGCLPPIAEVLSCVVPSFSSVYTRGKHGLHYLHITYSMEYTIHMKITECEVLI